MARGSEVACGVPALELAEVCDTATGVELSPMEWEALFWNHLDHARHCQNMMIRLNRNLGSKGEGFGNEWARRNVRLVSLPTGFGNLSHQNRVNQCEAARLTLAWKARERVADALDEIGWDKATLKDVGRRSIRNCSPTCFPTTRIANCRRCAARVSRMTSRTTIHAVRARSTLSMDWSRTGVWRSPTGSWT